MRSCSPGTSWHASSTSSAQKRVTLTAEALDAIDAYAWPGNVRELQNRLKRAIIMAESKRIGRVDLDLAAEDEDYAVLNLRQVRERAEIGALRRALARADGNISKTARLLGRQSSHTL